MSKGDPGRVELTLRASLLQSSTPILALLGILSLLAHAFTHKTPVSGTLLLPLPTPSLCLHELISSFAVRQSPSLPSRPSVSSSARPTPTPSSPSSLPRSARL